jgi:hypothetical protein
VTALTARLHQDMRALEWHRWIGTTSAVVIIGAALARAGVNRQSLKARYRYRIVLSLAAALVGAGHPDARLEGADFLRPY